MRGRQAASQSARRDALVALTLALGVIACTAGAPPAAGAATNAEAAAASIASIPGPVTLLSTSDAGVKGNADSTAPSVSSDGSTIAFTSAATNLFQFDIDSRVDVFVKDVATGTVELASRATSGTKANGDNANAAISADGRWVAFQSEADDLDPNDTDTTPDVYVKDMLLGDLTLASASTAGVKGNGTSGAHHIGIGRAGNKVVFDSDSTNLVPADTGNGLDVFLKNVSTGKLTLVSKTSSGVKSSDSSLAPSISASGKKVAFESFATVFDPGDTDHIEDIYVKDLRTGQLTLASTSAAGVKGDAASQDPVLSGNGNLVAFTSDADNLDPADTDSLPDVYVKNLTTGELTLVSTSDEGQKGNNPSFAPAISGDGKRIAFTSSAGNLDPADDDTNADVFEKDLTSGDLSLLSSSAEGDDGNLGSSNAALTGKGAFAVFESDATNLDPNDADTLADIYLKQPTMCTIVGTAGDDTLKGTSGDDVLCGGAGEDTIKGKGGNDTLFGEAGDDTLIGGSGADTVDGGEDEDTADYSDSAAGVSINLNDATFSGGDADGDLLTGIEDVTGSGLGDTLIGDNDPNTLSGLDGDDTLKGKNGDDTLIGAAGTDTFDGGGGIDSCDNTGGESETQCEP